MNRLKQLVSSKPTVGGEELNMNDVNELDLALERREKPMSKAHDKLDKLAKAQQAESEAERSVAQALSMIVDGGATFSGDIVGVARALATFENEFADLRDKLADALRDDVADQLRTLVKSDSCASSSSSSALWFVH